MAGFKDITGQRFGRWKVISRAANIRNRIHWNCICDCGTERMVSSGNLRDGLSVSCGCYKEEVTAMRCTKHGLARSKEYNAWSDAKRRCFDATSPQYHNYGGRGITMCLEWAESVERFVSDMGKCPPGLTLDRINNNGNYEPGNCRWTTMKVQANNMRKNIFLTRNGETLSLQQWAVQTGIPYRVLYARIYHKMNVDLFQPLKTRRLKRIANKSDLCPLGASDND